MFHFFPWVCSSLFFLYVRSYIWTLLLATRKSKLFWRIVRTRIYVRTYKFSCARIKLTRSRSHITDACTVWVLLLQWLLLFHVHRMSCMKSNQHVARHQRKKEERSSGNCHFRGDPLAKKEEERARERKSCLISSKNGWKATSSTCNYVRKQICTVGTVKSSEIKWI